MGYLFCVQQQKLTERQEVIAIYQEQVKSAGMIIRDNARFIVESVYSSLYNSMLDLKPLTPTLDRWLK